MRSKSSQVHLIVPVFVYGHDDSGVPFREVTRTLLIEATGGSVELTARASKRHPMLLVNIATGHSIPCRVASMRAGLNGKTEVGIYFALPSPGFWGVEFPPNGSNRTTPRNPGLAEP